VRDADQLLWEACRELNLSGAEEAISKGASVRSRNPNDRNLTALHYVALRPWQPCGMERCLCMTYCQAEMIHSIPSSELCPTVSVARMLVASGASGALKATFGTNVLHLAADQGNLAIIRLLLQSGTPMNSFDSLQRTPVHRAVLAGHVRLVEEMISLGCNISIVDYAEATPLLTAVRTGQREMVELLLRHGADPLRKDRWGSLPMSFAVKRKDKDIQSMLSRASSKKSSDFNYIESSDDEEEEEDGSGLKFDPLHFGGAHDYWNDVIFSGEDGQTTKALQTFEGDVHVL